MASGGGGGSEEGVEGGMEVDVKFWKFAGEGYQSRTSANMETVGGRAGGGGFKFWSFCENLIIECPLFAEKKKLFSWINFWDLQ